MVGSGHIVVAGSGQYVESGLSICFLQGWYNPSYGLTISEHPIVVVGDGQVVAGGHIVVVDGHIVVLGGGQ